MSLHSQCWMVIQSIELCLRQSGSLVGGAVGSFIPIIGQILGTIFGTVVGEYMGDLLYMFFNPNKPDGGIEQIKRKIFEDSLNAWNGSILFQHFSGL